VTEQHLIDYNQLARESVVDSRALRRLLKVTSSSGVFYSHQFPLGRATSPWLWSWKIFSHRLPPARRGSALPCARLVDLLLGFVDSSRQCTASPRRRQYARFLGPRIRGRQALANDCPVQGMFRSCGYQFGTQLAETGAGAACVEPRSPPRFGWRFQLDS